jgi:hypothetical protein
MYDNYHSPYGGYSWDRATETKLAKAQDDLKDTRSKLVTAEANQKVAEKKQKAAQEKLDKIRGASVLASGMIASVLSMAEYARALAPDSVNEAEMNAYSTFKKTLDAFVEEINK